MRTEQWVDKLSKLNAPPTDREPEPIPDLVQREPNKDDPPYRPAPIPKPGQPPWPGYPKPMPPGAPPAKIASHDNRQFKSVPATGPRGDQPAGEIKDFLERKDENLLQTQARIGKA